MNIHLTTQEVMLNFKDTGEVTLRTFTGTRPQISKGVVMLAIWNLDLINPYIKWK